MTGDGDRRIAKKGRKASDGYEKNRRGGNVGRGSSRKVQVHVDGGNCKPVQRWGIKELTLSDSVEWGTEKRHKPL